MSNEVTIGAISDIHSPKYLEDFKRVLGNSPDVDLMFLAGDMIYKGQVKEYEKVLKVIRSRYGKCEVVACFGNEEYDNKVDDIVKSFDEVVWLNDDYITLNVKDLEIHIVGTRGCLDRPTAWQRKNIPNIVRIYEERLRKIDDVLAFLAFKESGFIILLSHYAITFKTLIGEPQWAWPELGSSKLEEVIRRRKPHIVIHGHAHNSKVYETTIDKTQVYNVSFPATRKLTIIKWHKVEEVGVKGKRQLQLTSFMSGKP